METIRKYEKEMELTDAIDRALDEIPEDYQIRPYLEANRKEVKTMLLTEYNEKETMEMFKEEGRAEGRAEGEDASRITVLKTVMGKMKISAQKAMDFLDIAPEDQKRYAPLLKEASEQ